MATFNSRYEGDFFEGLDFPQGERVNLKIAKVREPQTVKDASGKVIKEGVLEFEDERKMLVLSKTNVKVMWACIGKDETAWVGWTITLMRRYYPQCFGAKNHLCVRITPPDGTALPVGVLRHMGRAVPYSEEDIAKWQKRKITN